MLTVVKMPRERVWMSPYDIRNASNFLSLNAKYFSYPMEAKT